VLTEYDLPPEALAVLSLACQAQDRYADARRAIDEHGTTFNDRWGQVKVRPEVLVERDSRQAVARLLKQLGLDLEPLHPGRGRPPGS
jgi:P27 family predicted phage terminase small subunit